MSQLESADSKAEVLSYFFFHDILRSKEISRSSFVSSLSLCALSNNRHHSKRSVLFNSYVAIIINGSVPVGHCSDSPNLQVRLDTATSMFYIEFFSLALHLLLRP